MGLTFAKSVRFGAVRFNFSGSGIGMSVGVPGLRIGTGPRGAYIAGGMAGFRYRKSLNSPSRGMPAQTTPVLPGHVSPGQPAVQPPSQKVMSTVEHDTKNVLELRDSTSDALLQSMNEQRSAQPLWPFGAGSAAIAWFMVHPHLARWPGWAEFFIAAVLAAAVYWVYWRDSMRRLTVLFYDLDAQAAKRFEDLCEAFRSAHTQKLRAVASTSRYANVKYSAGAGQGLKLEAANHVHGQGPGVAANISVPILKTGKTTLAFYPDRVLAFQGKRVGAVTYKSLVPLVSSSRFIETEGVPSDASVIDHTWKYVNKKRWSRQEVQGQPAVPRL
jgi:hypothetical protein